MVRVAVDAMGGDNAPAEIVKGCLQALKKEAEIQVLLVGKEEGVLFGGRLAEYRYYDMAPVVEKVLQLWK